MNMDFGNVEYLWKPSDIRSLNSTQAVKLGLMNQFKSYDEAKAKSKNLFNGNERLICTIEVHPNSTTKFNIISMDYPLQTPTLAEFNANDSCYPISRQEWNQFLLDEKDNKVRTPLELWVVDRNKYTAPI